MNTLAEYLEQEATRLEAERPSRVAALSEWQSAIDTLFRQFEEWIHQADNRKIVQIEYGEVTLRENRLGAYRIKTMTVAVDSQSVTLEPRARYVSGVLRVKGQDVDPRVEGRVDGMVWGSVAESIYRAKIGDAYQWFVPKRSANVAESHFLPLTQELFGRFLLDLLA
jgi:hypothetical protein